MSLKHHIFKMSCICKHHSFRLSCHWKHYTFRTSCLCNHHTFRLSSLYKHHTFRLSSLYKHHTFRLSCCFFTSSRLLPGEPWDLSSASISSSQDSTSARFSFRWLARGNAASSCYNTRQDDINHYNYIHWLSSSHCYKLLKHQAK